MKIKHMLTNLIKNDQTKDHLWSVPDDMLYEFNMQNGGDLDLSNNSRLECYWLGSHRCTDTEVGLRCYILDGNPVSISMQKGRKCDEVFEWVSMEAFKTTHTFLLSLKEEDELPQPSIIDMEEDLGEGYPVEYVGQLLTKQVMYDNCMVDVVEELEVKDGEMNFHGIIIKHPTEGLMSIDIRDIFVPWNA